jgi:LmbE family N-acetylglucosaminyl deacetylase
VHETASRTLLVVVAHPDDESFGCGALIASAVQTGARVVVYCASRGERGEDASGQRLTGAELGRAREAELRESARLLGASTVELLDLVDSGWDGVADPGSIVAEPQRLGAALDEVLRRHRPDVVVTLDPTGSDGHRDHAAVGQATTEAFDRVVDWPASLYHWCLPHSLMDAWSRQVAARDPDSVYLETELGRADLDVTTVLDGRAVLDVVQRAIDAHRTQASPFEGISPALVERFVRFDYLVRQRPAWPDASGVAQESALLWPAHDAMNVDRA